jgi:hypothetical protein
MKISTDMKKIMAVLAFMALASGVVGQLATNTPARTGI